MDWDYEKLRDFLGQLLENSDGNGAFTDKQSLILNGRLDSVGVTRLILFLEANYKVTLSKKIKDVSDLDSFEKIKEVLESADGL